MWILRVEEKLEAMKLYLTLDQVLPHTATHM